MPGWTIRPYQRGDETSLVELFARVFGRPMSDAHWRWKLGVQEAPVPNVFVAMHGEASALRPIFQCAGIPTRFRGPAGPALGMVAVDAMTDPDFRRQGVMTDVNRHAYDEWRRAGVAFVIGLPNEQWGSRTRALGWQPVCSLAWRIRVLRPDRIVSRRYGRAAGLAAAPLARVYRRVMASGGGNRAGLTTRVVTDAGAFDDLWRGIEQHRAWTGYSIVRDRAWIQWRYLDSPDVRYTIHLGDRSGAPAGYAVTRIKDADGRRIGYVADLAAIDDDPDVLRVLIAAAIDELDRAGVELVAGLAVPGTPVDRALSRAGCRFGWGAFDVQMVPLQPGMSLDPFGVAGGDFDVV